MHLRTHGPHIDGPHLRFFAETVACDGTGDLRHNVAHHRIIGTENGRAIKRHAVQKIDKGLFQPAKVMSIGFHVVSINIGDHRHHGQQVQKGCVRFIGLHNDVVARAELGVGTGAVEAAANHKGRVQSAFGQHACHEAGGGGFPMGAGDGNALFEAHQFRQHHRAGHHRDAPLARGQHLGVVGLHGR